MTKRLTLATSLIVALALGAPPLASAQASRRGGSEGGSGGSGSGSAGGRTSSEPSVGTAQPRSAPAPQAPSVERSRPAGPDAGDRRVASRPAASGSDNPRVTRVQSTADRVAGVRVRGAQPARGVAQARTNTPPRGSNGSVYYFYPRYGYSPYGYRSYYDPWYYGSGPWGWNRFGYGYGSWHTPYLYDPFAYGYLSGPYYWGSSGYSDRDDRDDRDSESMGSLRLRVSPRQAKVYVDGALAGVVDEFDGLGSHLQLPAGRHQVEFRAEGYATLTREVVVEAGKTRTERASLERR